MLFYDEIIIEFFSPKIFLIEIPEKKEILWEDFYYSKIVKFGTIVFLNV